MQISIDDPSDPRISAYRSVKERDLVGRQGLFVAEGEVVLRLLVGSSLMDTLSVFISEKRVETLSPILAHLPANVPVYTASQGVMDQIVGFPIHRGILALGCRRETLTAQALLGSIHGNCLVLALVGICNHDNMGAIFRNAAAFGVDAILLDPECCDPLYRKSIRVSVGGVLKVPFAKLAPSENMLEVLASNQIVPFALSPSGLINLAEMRRPPRAAVLLGAEGHGLPKSVLDAAQTVSIPMAGGFDSLNVATTSGIVLHQLSLRNTTSSRV